MGNIMKNTFEMVQMMICGIVADVPDRYCSNDVVQIESVIDIYIDCMQGIRRLNSDYHDDQRLATMFTKYSSSKLRLA